MTGKTMASSMEVNYTIPRARRVPLALEDGWAHRWMTNKLVITVGIICNARLKSCASSIPTTYFAGKRSLPARISEGKHHAGGLLGCGGGGGGGGRALGGHSRRRARPAHLVTGEEPPSRRQYPHVGRHALQYHP